MEALPLQLIWGCDPSRQLEVAWLRTLLGSLPVEHLAASQLAPDCLQPDRPRLLVESGLLRLERQPSSERLQAQHRARADRLALLAAAGPFTLVHLSDEEGLDGDELYPMVPPGSAIWRNFAHPRFAAIAGLVNFPIGPRAEFLSPLSCMPASTRAWPWAFMGTLWGSGSRVRATALFLHALPQGFFYGGRHFGVGLPLAHYRDTIGQSVFALCPEGDRHLDTFRLYESLQMGCLPLVVDVRDQARTLLGPDYPLPIFSSWSTALHFAQAHLAQPERQDELQQVVTTWWQGRCQQLAIALQQCCRLC